MSESDNHAPGRPGSAMPWTTSRKSGVGVAHEKDSRVWFTLADGILTEIFYPRVDCAGARDFQFLVADGQEYFSEEARDTDHRTETIEGGVPAFRMRNECRQGKYRLTKEILTSPEYHTVMLRCQFEPLEGDDLKLYAILAPRLHNVSARTNARLIRWKGDCYLVAERGGSALALGCSPRFSKMSVGFLGESDGWTDISRNKQLTACYDRADQGNVGLVGEVDWREQGEAFCVSIGFGRDVAEAVHRVRASLQQGFESARDRYFAGWRGWQESTEALAEKDSRHFAAYRTSAAVLSAHESRDFHGAVIASLSCPWCAARGSDNLGGYHLFWPRDLFHAATALMALGAKGKAKKSLDFLHATQEENGRWPQSMWLDGAPYGEAKQLDEVAAPVLLADLAREKAVCDPSELRHLWPMVRKAADYISKEGPASNQDRWEELGGISVYTLVLSIAALLSAAEFGEALGEEEHFERWRGIADEWNDSVEDWCYVEGGELSDACGAKGHYFRVRPVDEEENPLPKDTPVFINNRADGENRFPASSIVSLDFLALVRFGLRAPDDPRILDTIKVVDEYTKVDTERGPAWRRYNQDGYGEKEDGSPFDGQGIGRPWPLLCGERAHYEMAAGRAEEAQRLLDAMVAFSSETGMMPEQIWDEEAIPEKGLYPGQPTSGACPLVWAHSEYIVTLRSLRDKTVFDAPDAARKRYLGETAK